MKQTDFAIGTEFYTTAGKWRCTDVGSRTIIAIKLGPRKIVSLDTEHETVTESVQDDESWLNGPPYAVEEVIFDENDIDGCQLLAANEPDDLDYLLSDEELEELWDSENLPLAERALEDLQAGRTKSIPLEEVMKQLGVEDKQTDKFGHHEVLHTAFIMSEMWDNYILKHLVVVGNPELRAAAERIGDEIGAFYQLVGGQNLD